MMNNILLLLLCSFIVLLVFVFLIVSFSIGQSSTSKKLKRSSGNRSLKDELKNKTVEWGISSNEIKMYERGMLKSFIIVVLVFMLAFFIGILFIDPKNFFEEEIYKYSYPILGVMAVYGIASYLYSLWIDKKYFFSQINYKIYDTGLEVLMEKATASYYSWDDFYSYYERQFGENNRIFYLYIKPRNLIEKIIRSVLIIYVDEKIIGNLDEIIGKNIKKIEFENPRELDGFTKYVLR